MRNEPTVYSAAVYCRLSKDDEQAGESVSIETQKMMLTDFCHERGFSIYEIYADDGYSGLNFNRPAFTKLLEDIDSGKVNLVITKDLSRLGRDYIQTGYYTDVYFTRKRVRYIAVNDGIDTNREDNDIAPFKNILNDMYARDLSRKVKSAKRQRAFKGYYISAQAPYGYKVDPQNRNRLIVDDEAAEVVKEIFRLSLAGHSLIQISRILTERKIITPGVYKAQNGDTRFSRYQEGKSSLFGWCYQTVRAILRDQVYTGDMVNHKYEVINYKTKERARVPKEQHIIVTDRHEPIVSRDDYERVQSLISMRHRPKKHNFDNVFRDLTFCAECGHRMTLMMKPLKAGLMPLIRCTHHYSNPEDCKHNHYIYYDDLYAEVLKRVQNIARQIERGELLEQIQKQSEKRVKTDKLVAEQVKINKRLSALKRIIKKLYEDFDAYFEVRQQYGHTYHNQGQLLKADGDTTYTYTYDGAGNILTASNGTTTHTYTYGNADWKDLLTAFDGNSITYDAIGNPTSYYNGTRWTMSWTNGRSLATASKSGTSLSFAYDANGLRTSKTVNGTTYCYYYAGGKLMRMTWDTNTIDFFYDANGAPYAMKYNGTVYYYVTNLQGDVMRIVNASGTVMASYDYDPYGKVISATGTLANVNPLRYRGYVYDQETGFYYLQSRYYDPAIGRFINADGLMSTTQKVLGHNMFAYGYNSSVNCVDPTGCCPHDGKFYTSGVFSGQFEYNAECSLCAAHGEFYLVGAGNVLINMVQFALSYEQKVLISTIAAEASVTALGTPVSSQARQAMANVALNRVGSREWSRYTSVAEICQYTGFDGYGGSNYWACMNYLNQRDGSNSIYEEIIWDVLSAYENDITNGCQLYYTPAAMQGNKRPNWNFSLLEEEYIYGVDSVYEGCFFRYK